MDDELKKDCYNKTLDLMWIHTGLLNTKYDELQESLQEVYSKHNVEAYEKEELRKISNQLSDQRSLLDALLLYFRQLVH